jgi:hypothetical protein
LAQSLPIELHETEKSRAEVEARAASIPWYLWCAALSLTSIVGGLYWDISWHMSIGRDTFLTPAHLAIHFGGMLVAIACAYLILSRTFGSARAERASSVRIFGLHGPLGAFICAWGGFTMLTSAPFDDWWHNAYGLDVQIISPPHTVLFMGIMSVGIGALMLILGHMNRASGDLQAKLDRLFLYMGAMLLILSLMFVWEHSYRDFMHSASFYRALSLATPIALLGPAIASRHKWACTMVAGIYTIGWLIGLWLFPLFPAEAKLGPVFNRVTHMIPLDFPLLVLVPAMALDLVNRRLSGRNRWLHAAVAGTVFLVVFAAAQWPFANFLMSPAARNAAFGTHYFDYATDVASYNYEFAPVEKTAREFWKVMGFALLAAMATSRIGLAWGASMRRLQR